MRLFKDYTEEFEDLQNEIGALKSKVSTTSDRDLIKIQSLEDEVRDMKISVNQMIMEFIELKQMLSKEEPTGMVEEEINIDDDVRFGKLNIPETIKSPYNYDTLDENTFKFEFKTVRNKVVWSIFTVFDLQVLQGLENEKSWTTWKEISELVGFRPNMVKKMAYNVKVGFLDKFDIDNLLSFSKEYGLLYVNNKKTQVPIRTVKYIVECMQNSNKPFTTLMKLEKSKECSQFMYRVIGANYNNKELLSLLGKEDVDVENNPQKRREAGII